MINFEEGLEQAAWERKKTQILEDFEVWLDELDGVQDLPIAEEDESQKIGSLQLFSELAALRQEVNLQSKNNKQIAGSLTELTGELHEKLASSPDLGAAVDELKGQIPQARLEARKQVLQEFLPVIEGLQRSLETLSKSSLPTFLFAAAKQELIENLSKPIALLNSKAQDSLARLHVQTLATVGKPFDATTMRATGTTSGSGQKTGCVSELMRQGYSLRGEILQIAEVKVEK